jgi:hypothetical protein
MTTRGETPRACRSVTQVVEPDPTRAGPDSSQLGRAASLSAAWAVRCVGRAWRTMAGIVNTLREC